MWYSSKVLPCPLPIIWSLKIEIRNLDNRWDFVNIYAYQKGIAQLKSAAIPFFFWIYQFLMSFRSITYTNDLLAEFNIKMTVSKSGYSYKILQYLAEPSNFCEIEQILLSIYAQPWRLKVFSVLLTYDIVFEWFTFFVKFLSVRLSEFDEKRELLGNDNK